MKKDEIKQLLMSMRTRENDASVTYLLGLIDMISEKDLSIRLQELNINPENIKPFLVERIAKVQKQQEHSEHFTSVNKMFCYGRTGNTIHMHLIPKDLRGIKARLGDEAFYQFYKDQLEDFLARLQETFRNDSTITSLFAVSPIFFNPNISTLHEDLGFDEIIEVNPENQEDKMSIEQKEYFLNMFNKNNDHRRRVYYTSMSREKLLGTAYTLIPENEKSILDD